MEMEFAGILIIPLIIGLLEVIKRVGLNKKFIPVISLVFGIIAGIFLFSNGDISVGVVQGLYMGLSAVGLYSGTKNTIE